MHGILHGLHPLTITLHLGPLQGFRQQVNQVEHRILPAAAQIGVLVVKGGKHRREGIIHLHAAGSLLLGSRHHHGRHHCVRIHHGLIGIEGGKFVYKLVAVAGQALRRIVQRLRFQRTGLITRRPLRQFRQQQRIRLCLLRHGKAGQQQRGQQQRQQGLHIHKRFPPSWDGIVNHSYFT